MADKKISDLVASNPVVTAAPSDAYETTQGGVSKGTTNAKIATLIETILTKLLLSGGGNALNADGSASFGNGSVIVTVGGNLQVGAGAAEITPIGDINAQSIGVLGAGVFGTQVDAAGGFAVNGAVGVTGDFVILDSGVPKTFHFESGILTSVT